MTRLPDLEVGEALPLGVTSDIDISGATVVARVSVNGAAAVEMPGTPDEAVGGEVLGAVVPIPGTTFAAAGWVEGVVVITKAGAIWSPAKKRFSFRLRAVV